MLSVPVPNKRKTTAFIIKETVQYVKQSAKQKKSYNEYNYNVDN
jgi:hypothetical protein